MAITPLQEAMRRLNDVPAQTRMEVIRGVTVRRKKNGLTVLSLHYSAIPDRDPLTPKGQAWYKRAHSKYASEARWKKEQEIDPYATGGEAVFGQVLSKYYQVVVISDQYWAPDPRWDVIGGFDHGSTNATCLLKAYVPREEFDPTTGRKKAPDVYLCGEYYSYRREGWQNNVDQNVLMMKGGKNDAGEVFEGMPDMDRARWIMADPSIFWNTKVEDKGAPTNIYSTYKKNGMFPLRSYDGIRSDITFVEWIMSDYWRGIANGRKPRLYIVCRNPSDRPQPGLHPYDCPNLLWELKRAKRVEMTARQLLTKNPSENLQDKHNHARDCLSGDTLITTRAGLVPICDVQVGSEVLTRKGLRAVEDAWCADPAAKVLRVDFADGSKLIGTAKHLVWVVGADFTRMDRLKEGMLVQKIGGTALSIVHISELPERMPVYDLTVQGEPEFFANGILVHNCFKYMTGMLRNPTEIPYEEALNEELSKLDLTTASIRARFLMSDLARQGKLDPVTGQPRKGKAPRQIDLRRGPGVMGRR